eukprot:SAG31_NODE_87_length_26728_cov_40.161591_3_plen_224_part_00
MDGQHTLATKCSSVPKRTGGAVVGPQVFGSSIGSGCPSACSSNHPVRWNHARVQPSLLPASERSRTHNPRRLPSTISSSTFSVSICDKHSRVGSADRFAFSAAERVADLRAQNKAMPLATRQLRHHDCAVTNCCVPRSPLAQASALPPCLRGSPASRAGGRSLPTLASVPSSSPQRRTEAAEPGKLGRSRAGVGAPDEQHSGQLNVLRIAGRLVCCADGVGPA